MRRPERSWDVIKRQGAMDPTEKIVKPQIFRDDWKRGFELEGIAESIRRIA